MYKKTFNISDVGGSDNSINVIERISSIAPDKDVAPENEHYPEQTYNGEQGEGLPSFDNTELIQNTIFQLFEEEEYEKVVNILSKFSQRENSFLTKFQQSQIENQDFLLGMALLGLGDYENAKKHFTQELEQNPNFQEAKNGLGLVFYALGEDESAMFYLEGLDDKSKELLGLTNTKFIPSAAQNKD